MTIVITSCTNRKRRPVEVGLVASALTRGDLLSVAEEWGGRLKEASNKYPASEVYGGRAFQEARLAAEKVGGRLLIISAGLGAVEASSLIPSYACTVQKGAHDSIAERIEAGFSTSKWWSGLKETSPYHIDLPATLDGSDGLVLAALSEGYFELIADDLLQSDKSTLARLRIFTRTPASRLPEELQASVMPYDDRLDGPDSPIKGARSDFAPRAMRHFVENIMPSAKDGSAQEHADAVGSVLRDWGYLQKVERERLEDNEIIKLIEKHWDAADGSTSKLLRVFRDELKVACEQGRFAMLARKARAGRS